MTYDCNASPLINDEQAREEAVQIARKLLGEDKVTISEAPVFGFAADDFAEYIKDVPGVYAHVGTAMEGSDSARVLHSEKLAPAEEAVEVAADLHINYALNFLGQDKEYLSELDDTLAKI